MSSENGFTDHGLDLRTFNNSFNQNFYDSVSVASDLAETEGVSKYIRSTKSEIELIDTSLSSNMIIDS